MPRKLKPHIRIYLHYFDYKADNFEDLQIPCEWSVYPCEWRAVDINHIRPRRMGGSNTKDFIENLVAMCRYCHNEFEAGRIDKDELQNKHIRLMHEN